MKYIKCSEIESPSQQLEKILGKIQNEMCSFNEIQFSHHKYFSSDGFGKQLSYKEQGLIRRKSKEKVIELKTLIEEGDQIYNLAENYQFNVSQTIRNNYKVCKKEAEKLLNSCKIKDETQLDKIFNYANDLVFLLYKLSTNWHMIRLYDDKLMYFYNNIKQLNIKITPYNVFNHTFIVENAEKSVQKLRINIFNLYKKYERILYENNILDKKEYQETLNKCLAKVNSAGLQFLEVTDPESSFYQKIILLSKEKINENIDKKIKALQFIESHRNKKFETDLKIIKEAHAFYPELTHCGTIITDHHFIKEKLLSNLNANFADLIIEESQRIAKEAQGNIEKQQKESIQLGLIKLESIFNNNDASFVFFILKNMLTRDLIFDAQQDDIIESSEIKERINLMAIMKENFSKINTKSSDLIKDSLDFIKNTIYQQQNNEDYPLNKKKNINELKELLISCKQFYKDAINEIQNCESSLIECNKIEELMKYDLELSGENEINYN